jgi:hypothetical protein
MAVERAAEREGSARSKIKGAPDAERMKKVRVAIVNFKSEVEEILRE